MIITPPVPRSFINGRYLRLFLLRLVVFTEALVKCGLVSDAAGYIKRIWGGMIERGADTFYEVYVPDDPDFSPYRDRMVNSMCHAWSCTPSYFIRKYKL